jgi:hypothetical protein
MLSGVQTSVLRTSLILCIQINVALAVSLAEDLGVTGKGSKQIEHCVISTFQIAQKSRLRRRLSRLGAFAADSRMMAAHCAEEGKICLRHFEDARPDSRYILSSQSYAQRPFESLESARCRFARFFHYSLIGKADQQRWD